MTTLEKYLEKLRTLQIHIIGASGTEGAEIATFLHKHQIQDVTLHDFSENQIELHQSFLKSHSGYPAELQMDQLNLFKQLPYQINYKENYLATVENADLIFVPQSWFLHQSNNKLLELQNKIPFSSLTRLYLELAPCPIIGITGSNGKSTTTFLTYHLLSQDKTKKIFLTGNDRQATQILNQIETITPSDLIVTEISNRQLLNTDGLSPSIAVLTNISENHLNEHDGLQGYINTKAKITAFQKPDQHFIYNQENAYCQQIASKSPAQLHAFGITSNLPAYYDQEAIYLNSEKLINLTELQIYGEHNYQNALAAILAANLAGLSPNLIAQGLKTFQGLPNRIQKVLEKNSFTFYNDRQGTAIDATVKAIQSLSKPLTIILGGQNKKMNPAPLIDELNQTNIITIGIQSPFTDEIHPHLTNYHQTNTLTEAVNLATQISPPNTNILFSPACEYAPYFGKKPQNSDSENFNEIIQAI